MAQVILKDVDKVCEGKVKVAFALKLRKVSRSQIEERVQRAAAILGTQPLLDPSGSTFIAIGPEACSGTI